MSPSSLVIIDYGMGNLHSVVKRVRRLGADWTIASEPDAILKADKLILPGVGHFGKAMENLATLNLIPALNEAVLSQKTPILGICLGMQLMTRRSEEGHRDGLGWFDAEVLRFDVKNSLQFKVPHIGWNQIRKKKDSLLDVGVEDGAEFYFVHSYFVKCSDQTDALHETTYEETFTSAIQKDNLYGVQYHPEKSHDVGFKLLENFVKLGQ